MGIDFNPQRWDRVRETYGQWWAKELDRPVIPVIVKGNDPGRPEPETPLLTQQTSLDLSVPAGDLIDRIDYELSKNIYLGDSFPYYNMDCFGPGVVAAFLGAVPDNSTGNIWFEPEEIVDLKDMHFQYDPENIWWKRVQEIYREAVRLWNGDVVIGMVDLGGILDILATFRSTERLLMDLYDQPEEIKRLTWEIHELWMRYYHEINDILSPVARGYSDWSKIFSEKPSYVIQSDFTFMVGTPMFVEFAKPELQAAAAKIPHTLFHLDGPGELNHLDELLSIGDINAIQWVPGAGAPPQTQWPEVYRKISQAGKGIQLFDGLDCIEAVAAQIGTTRGLLHWDIEVAPEEMDTVIKRLEKFGVTPR